MGMLDPPSMFQLLTMRQVHDGRRRSTFHDHNTSSSKDFSNPYESYLCSRSKTSERNLML